MLAGGGATRFGGRPKGLETIGGERILDRLVDTLTEALGEPPLLVANAPDAGAWRPGLRVVPDVRPGLGALGVGTTIAAGKGYQLRWEVRDNIVGIQRVTSATSGPGQVPPHETAYKHIFSLNVGFDVILERQRGRRY